MIVEQDVETVVVDAQRLEDFVIKVFLKLGMTESNARDAAEVLIKADITGVDSHGVPRLPNYVNRLKAGAIEANLQPFTIPPELEETWQVEADFIRLVRGELEEGHPTFREGVGYTELAEATMCSAREGRWVSLPLA